jgi:hypothetical protein
MQKTMSASSRTSARPRVSIVIPTRNRLPYSSSYSFGISHCCRLQRADTDSRVLRCARSMWCGRCRSIRGWQLTGSHGGQHLRVGVAMRMVHNHPRV